MLVCGAAIPLRGRINARQERVLRRMFREGPEGLRAVIIAIRYEPDHPRFMILPTGLVS